MISVVITAFRRHQFILEAVRSVLASPLDRNSYEIVLVTDGLSSELSQQLTDLRVRTVFSDTPFVGESMALGVTNSRGEVVAFCDDDDRFHPEKLGVLLEVFSNPCVVYYHHGNRRVDGCQNALRARAEIAPIRAQLDLPLTRGEMGWVRRKGGFLNASSIALRRSALLPHVAALQGTMTAPDFAMLLLLDGPGAVVLDGTRVLADYRIHPSQGTHLFRGNCVPSEHISFISRMTKSFESLQFAAPTHSARRFARCRADSYQTVVWALTGELVTQDPKIRRRAMRAIIGNLREMDLLSMLVLTGLVSISAISRNWVRRFYAGLRRAEQEGLGVPRAHENPTGVPTI